MKQLIFYFTATGNSLHVAKQFDSDPINIAIQRPDRFVADRIGFVFPVYCGEMPAVLVEVGFINNDKDNALLDAQFDATARAIADGIAGTLWSW